MEIAQNEENNETSPLNNNPPPSPTTAELCTVCTQYIFANTFQLEQVLEKRFTYNP